MPKKGGIANSNFVTFKLSHAKMRVRRKKYVFAFKIKAFLLISYSRDKYILSTLAKMLQSSGFQVKLEME